jgi:outer membrane lipoprotein SlyB
MMNKRALWTLILISMPVFGCSQMMAPKTPDFFPNETYKATGSDAANAAAQECMALADEYVKDPNKYGSIAKDAAIGGAVGAGTGAIGGVIMKESVGRATAAGAAIGGLLGVVKGLSDMNERSPSYERFVEYCLQKKGYETIGWSSK